MAKEYVLPTAASFDDNSHALVYHPGRNYVGALYEVAQQQFKPEFRIVSSPQGAESLHAVEVKFGLLRAQGLARTRNEAKQRAAKKLLDMIGEDFS